MAKLNSMQAYQLSAALTPSFMSNIVPGSSQANSLAMQYGGAQQGVSVEAYKKAMKDAEPSDLEKVLGYGTQAIGMISPMKSLFGGGGGGGGSSLSNAAFQSVPLSPGSPTPTGATDMWGQPVNDPFGVTSLATAAPEGGAGAPQMAPAASMAEGGMNTAPTGEAPAAAKDGGGGGGLDIGTVAAAAGGAALLKGAANRGEQNMAQSAALDTALANVSDPRQRGRIMQWAQMGPKDFEAMNTPQRITAITGLVGAGIPLTRQQVRGIPENERRMYQKHYGPDLVPMTGLDKLNSFIDAYDQTSGPGRIVRPYSGLEMYIP